MGLISLPTTFVDGTIPSAAQFNGDFTTIANEFNGNIDNSNIKSAAGILESKIAFNASTGHSHNGSDSKLIAVNRAFVWFLSGTLATGASQSIRYIVPQNMTVVKCWLVGRTSPTGQAILIDINVNGTTIWATQGNRATLADGDADGINSTTTFNTTALSAGQYLDLDVDQVGSSVAGANLAVILECSQP